MRGRRRSRRRGTRGRRPHRGAEPVGVLVRPLRRRVARDGRIPAPHGFGRDGADGASGRERDGGAVAAGRTRRSAAHPSGRSATRRRRARRAQRDACHRRPEVGRYGGRNPAALLRQRRRDRGGGGSEDRLDDGGAWLNSNGDEGPLASLDAAAAPAWLEPLLANVAEVPRAYRRRVPADMLAAMTAAGVATKRDAAVLVLFS